MGDYKSNKEKYGDSIEFGVLNLVRGTSGPGQKNRYHILSVVWVVLSPIVNASKEKNLLALQECSKRQSEEAL